MIFPDQTVLLLSLWVSLALSELLDALLPEGKAFKV